MRYDLASYALARLVAEGTSPMEQRRYRVPETKMIPIVAGWRFWYNKQKREGGSFLNRVITLIVASGRGGDRRTSSARRVVDVSAQLVARVPSA